MKKICCLLLLICWGCLESVKAFNYDYSQTWVSKMFLSKPDPKGGCIVNLTFEQALDVIRATDNLSLGIPKVVYLVGWQYNGHDDKYPAFFDANPLLKRDCDQTALESLRRLMREAGTIHSDAWIARPSEGHNETVICEALYQQKAALYWKSKGMDITSEWVMDYMIGYVPYAWHFNGFNQADYLKYPATVYTGTGINPDIKSSDHDLGFLFGTSCYGEPVWLGTDPRKWEKNLVKDFMLKVPQYFFLNRLDRDSVSGEGKNRMAWFSEGVVVSLKDSTVTQYDRVFRQKNTLCMPAVWRNDRGVVLYSENDCSDTQFDVPYNWGNVEKAKLYLVTLDGLKFQKEVTLKKGKLRLKLDGETPYYAIPYWLVPKD